MTLSSEFPFSELFFLRKLNHLIWIFVEEVMAKIRKLLKAEKLQLFTVTTREYSDESWQKDMVTTCDKGDDSWKPKLASLDSKAFILHSSKSKTCSKHLLRLKICMNCINNKINYLETKITITYTNKHLNITKITWNYN